MWSSGILSAEVVFGFLLSHCFSTMYVISSRSNPDGIAVTLASVNQNQLQTYEIKKFDGSNWEDFFTNSDIQNFSKP
jgi:hypothetical protein